MKNSLALPKRVIRGIGGMNTKRFFLAWLAVYVFCSITGYIEHDVILHHTYMSLQPALHSGDVKSKIWAFVISAVVSTFFYTLIYSSWKKKGTVGEGLKYGIFIGLWMWIVMTMRTYASTDLIPFSLAMQWLVYGIIQYALGGMVMAVVYNYKRIPVKTLPSMDV